MPVSRRRWRPRDLGQAWCPLAAGSAGPRPRPAGSDRGDQPLTAFAGQLLAGGPEQRLTRMQRDGTPARESNSAPASADAAGSQAADHLGHGDLRKAGVMTGYHTGWACPPEQPERLDVGSASMAVRAQVGQFCTCGVGGQMCLAASP